MDKVETRLYALKSRYDVMERMLDRDSERERVFEIRPFRKVSSVLRSTVFDADELARRRKTTLMPLELCLRIVRRRVESLRAWRL